jgi:hypothetical protein
MGGDAVKRPRHWSKPKQPVEWTEEDERRADEDAVNAAWAKLAPAMLARWGYNPDGSRMTETDK